jgi:hypothetical protein
MAKASRGRVGTYALEKPLVRWMRSGEQEPREVGHMGATASRQAKLVIQRAITGGTQQPPGAP